MIDIHCHVLPFVDYDGPRTLDHSVEMLRCAEKEGIDVIVATPHVVTADLPAKMTEVRDALILLREAARSRNVPIELRLGAEMYVGPDLYEFVKSNPLLLEDSGGSVLVELPMHDIPPYAQPQLIALAADGLTAVLAHPERNFRVVKDPAVLQPLARAGVLFQVNSGSLIGDFGREVRKTANSLVASGLCHFVASDAHNSGSRGFSNRAARAAVERIAGEAGATAIFEHNPSRLLGKHTGGDSYQGSYS